MNRKTSPNEDELLVILAKRNNFPGTRHAGIRFDDKQKLIWHHPDVYYETEVCFVCGKRIQNCFNHEYDIYEHGLEHIKNSKLIALI